MYFGFRDICVGYGKKLAAFADEGYLKADGDKITLTRDGVFFGNNIVSDLIDCI